MITQKMLGSNKGWVKRTIPPCLIFISVLLLTIIFSLVISVAYATEITPAISKNVEIMENTSGLNYGATITVDRDKVAPGESFTVTVKKTDTNPIYTAKMVLNTSQINCLDADSIAFEKLNGFAANTPTSSYGVKVSGNQITVQFGNQTASYSETGDIFSITCKVSENSETGTISFESSSYIGYGCTQNNVLVTSPKGSGQMYFDFEIEIVASGSSGPSDPTPSTLTDDNFTEPASGYFTTAGITVTPSESDLSFTVACNNACVVAKVNDNGTYTRMTGTAVTGGYSFTADSASDQFVVVVKGDVGLDGGIDSTEVMQIKAAQLGKLTTFTALQNLAADLDGNSSISSTEVMQIKAAQLGKLTLTW